MKVLFIIPDYSGTGGAETVINTVCTELKNRKIKYHVYIAAKHKIKNETTNLKWLESIKHSRENFNLKFKNLNELFHSLKIKKIIRNEKIDKIITVDGKGISLARKAIGKNNKDIMLFSWAHITTQKVKGNNLFKKADHHITISKKISDQIEKIGVNRKDITTVYNPIYPQESTIAFNSKNFLFMGRLRESHKQVSTIFSALSKVSGEWILHIVGDGPDSEKYKHQVKELGIEDKVIFHGFIENPWVYIKKNIESVGALLLSSRIEGFPMVLCEAMSHGIYCISSDCETGPNEIIVKNINGQLFDVGDDKTLSFHIQNIIDEKTSIDQNKIKDSIAHLYTENYMNNLVEILYIKK
ncbi:glycosyltransferase [Denitrificimonas caeni]|uniref:Glycosyltransferase n=1 Tax=Denitrificimonas caeni TaxID=521720 RepID=A0AAE9VPS9_9GAMM|nr:glycosyltransferase [Denitrificimonas caeni]WBE26031.1 glycosyltransferase [Denitrificimonas caeni]